MVDLFGIKKLQKELDDTLAANRKYAKQIQDYEQESKKDKEQIAAHMQVISKLNEETDYTLEKLRNELQLLSGSGINDSTFGTLLDTLKSVEYELKKDDIEMEVLISRIRSQGKAIDQIYNNRYDSRIAVIESHMGLLSSYPDKETVDKIIKLMEDVKLTNNYVKGRLNGYYNHMTFAMDRTHFFCGKNIRTINALIDIYSKDVSTILSSNKEQIFSWMKSIRSHDVKDKSFNYQQALNALISDISSYLQNFKKLQNDFTIVDGALIGYTEVQQMQESNAILTNKLLEVIGEIKNIRDALGGKENTARKDLHDQILAWCKLMIETKNTARTQFLMMLAEFETPENVLKECLLSFDHTLSMRQEKIDTFFIGKIKELNNDRNYDMYKKKVESVKRHLSLVLKQKDNIIALQERIILIIKRLQTFYSYNNNAQEILRLTSLFNALKEDFIARTTHYGDIYNMASEIYLDYNGFIVRYPAKLHQTEDPTKAAQLYLSIWMPLKVK